MILAVVGSRRFAIPHATLYARHVIEHHLTLHNPDLVISGGAEGIDSIAIEVAARLGFSWEEFLPRNYCWEPHGYKERNITIAEACDVLVSIRCHAADTYGSGWTADYAKQIGKTVIPYVL